MTYLTEYRPEAWMISIPCPQCSTTKVKDFTLHHHYQEIYTMGSMRGEAYDMPGGNTVTANCVNGHQMGTFYERELEICRYDDKVNLTPDGNDILKGML